MAGWRLHDRRVGDRAGAAGLPELCTAAPVNDDHVCIPVVDESGLVLGHARVSPDLDERGRQALVNVLQAAQRLMAEEDAKDPEAAAERGRRQAAAIARIRERVRRRGEAR